MHSKKERSDECKQKSPPFLAGFKIETVLILVMVEECRNFVSKNIRYVENKHKKILSFKSLP
jgi:hypothetical protein